jgi:hypothetical protein
MPKKAEVDYIFSQKAGGARILVIFWFCCFFWCHTVSQENHNVYSKPSIVLLRSGKLIRLSLYSPDIVVVSPGVSDCTPSWNQRVTEYCGGRLKSGAMEEVSREEMMTIFSKKLNFPRFWICFLTSLRTRESSGVCGKTRDLNRFTTAIST